MALVVKNLPANAGDNPPEGGHGILLQYSRLENPVDTGAGQATVHRVTQTRTLLKRHHIHVSLMAWLQQPLVGHRLCTWAGPAGKETVSRSVPASESPSSIRKNALFKKKKQKAKQNKHQVNRTS